MSEVGADFKRDVSKINQVVDILATTAEGFIRFGIDWQHEDSIPVNQHLLEFVKDRLFQSWSRNHPLWLTSITKDLFSISNPAAVDYWINDGGATSESVVGLPFMNALDALVEVNDHLYEIVADAQSNFDSSITNEHLANGCTALTFVVLSSSYEGHELSRYVCKMHV